MPPMPPGIGAASFSGISATIASVVRMFFPIDPAMVTRSALQNAASIGKNILTTEAIVAEMPEKEAAPMPGGMGGMDGMM